MDANTYLSSLGIGVRDPARTAVGRLTLAGEFVLDGKRGALLRPKRGEVSNRYLEILASEGYAFVIVEGSGYPAVYAHEEGALVPIRALPIAHPQNFPSPDVLAEWSQLIRAAAGHGDAARLGVAQLLARIDGDDVFGPPLVLAKSSVPIKQLGGDDSVSPEPLRTAAALLAGFRMLPNIPDELVDLEVTLTSLLPDKGQFPGLTRILAPLVLSNHFATRRLVVSRGGGAEVAALLGAQGTIVLPGELRVLDPLFARLLPEVKCVFADFLRTTFEHPYDSAVMIPPLGVVVTGATLGNFDLAKRGDKTLGRVAAEELFVEHALANIVTGGLLVAVLPEGLLSSAGHTQFRHWLLERARLLAVVSLPGGMCFHGTLVKCSVVVLQKATPADDYPILMIDIEGNDIGADIEAARSNLDEFLEKELPACA